jgi:GNAT superfamily N-acetyltransferase
VSALSNSYTVHEGADAIAAHAFLTTSYWAQGITLDTVTRALDASLAVSIWHGQAQVAMARVISDYATFAYVNDVYVLDAHRGQGLGKAMIGWLRAHPRLQGLARWALYTKDAQALYAQFGWREYPYPDRMMIIDPVIFPE